MNKSAKVQNAAKILDQIKPGWAHLINLGNFDITHHRACVFYYVFGDYIAGFGRVEFKGSDCEGVFSGDVYQKDWVVEIRKRRELPKRTFKHWLMNLIRKGV